MQTERRFQGAMSADYLLVRHVIPDFQDLQRLVADAVAAYTPRSSAGPVRVLDLGCGDGATSGTLLARRQDAVVTALDNEEKMASQASANLAEHIRAGRCRVVLHDALDCLRGQPESSFDVVASALALHNLHRDYRHTLHGEIHRVLKPGGLFVNADKYAEDDSQRCRRLLSTLEAFFDTFVPLGKLDLLRACVLHEVADDAPERLMRADETVRELAGIGFEDVQVRSRHDMVALLTAKKPG